MKHRIIIPFVAAFLALFVVSSASAYECYNDSRSDQGNAAAAKAPALVSFEEFLADPEFDGLCPAGVAHVIEGLQEAGYDTDSLINFHTIMAQGLEKNGKGEDKLHDEQGIDHLSEEFFSTLEPLIGEGSDICAE